MAQSIFYIYEIKQCIEWIREDTRDLSLELFCASRPAVQLVERNLLVISEATKKLPDAFLARHPEVPWQEIKNIGNVLRHDYANVVPAILWSIVTDNIDQLASVIDPEIMILDQHHSS